MGREERRLPMSADGVERVERVQEVRNTRETKKRLEEKRRAGT